MVKSTKTIKSNAKKAFEKGNHSLAFLTLWDLENIDDFVSYAESFHTKRDKNTGKQIKKENWFTSNYFWNDFIIQQEYFYDLLKSESAIKLLHHYFESYKKQNNDFEKKVAKEFPELFVKAIRVNQVFLKPDRIESLQLLELDEKFRVHQTFWQYCSKIDLELWKDIQLEFECVKQLSIDDVFCHLITWLETHRFQNSDSGLLYHLSKVYSFFVELLLFEYNLNNTQRLNSDNLFNRFLKITESAYNGNKLLEKFSVSKSLELIYTWVDFYENTVVPYCFDMNFEPILELGIWKIKESAEANAKWKKGALRYKANKMYYDQLGFYMADYLEETGKLVIPGEIENDIEMNRDFEIRKWSTAFILEDIQHEHFKINREIIHPQNLLIPLLAFVRNKFDRYEKSLDCYTQTSTTWNEAFLKLTNLARMTSTQLDPFVLITEDNYKTLNEEVFPEFKKNNTNEVLKLFSFRKYDINNSFDRFNMNYNVWHKPFIKFGNLLFTPTMFFANNDWVHTFTEIVLKLNQNKQEKKLVSTKMENYLASKFEEKGLQVKVTTDEETTKMERGDVDIFVEDNDTLLFIQLKRTKFRLNPKDVYNEIVNVDLKASSQLNNAEKWLESPNEIYNVEKKPIKWIVTTSFENIGEIINGCIKVNYFDLLHLFRNMEIKSLRDIIHHIENDTLLNNYITTQNHLENGDLM